MGQLAAEHRHLQALVADPDVRVYGANTLVGHRDDEAVADPAAIAAEILRTHAIAGPPFYDAHAARCIGYTKLYQWSAGLSGVSPELFDAVAELVTRDDFEPQVPRQASYSCGDVIPASHWAQAVLQTLDGRRLAPGEIMALINGDFVHVGHAVSMVDKIEQASALTVETAALFHSLALANASNLYFHSTAERTWTASAVDHIRERARRPMAAADVQDPVSLRAIPQVLETWGNAAEDFMAETSYVLYHPSCNPFVDERHPFPISQASFLAPTLAIKTGGLMEAVLFLMWAALGWTKHLLSGGVEGIPRDGSTAASPLGLIQYPKLMAATCAKARLDLGRRTFAAGADTSYGVEDLWTNGALTLDQLDSGLDALHRLLCLALWVVRRVTADFGLEDRVGGDLLAACADCASATEMDRCVSDWFDSVETRHGRQGFWRD